MKLYDFSAFAARRDYKKQATLVAKEIADLVAHVDEPGALPELKKKVDAWFGLHKQIEQHETHTICI
jgi:hypothetical protein